MGHVRQIAKFVWSAAQLVFALTLSLGGLVIGASVGYAHGGWIGAVCLGLTGLALGAFVAASPQLLLTLAT